jgi:hypothetical protein
MIFKTFLPKKSAKNCSFDSKQSKIMQNFNHYIGFQEKRQFFRRKLPKIAKNSDHYIDPCFSTNNNIFVRFQAHRKSIFFGLQIAA